MAVLDFNICLTCKQIIIISNVAIVLLASDSTANRNDQVLYARSPDSSDRKIADNVLSIMFDRRLSVFCRIKNYLYGRA